MKLTSPNRVLGILVLAALLTQCIFPRPVHADNCSSKVCVYLPAIVRPPYLIAVVGLPFTIAKVDYAYPAYIENMSSKALKDIVLQVNRYKNTDSSPFQTFTVSLNAIEPSIYVLSAGDYAYFSMAWYDRIFPTPTMQLNALTWTVASAAENQPISVTGILTQFRTPYVTQVTVTVQNNYSESLKPVEISVWYLDMTGQSSCMAHMCYDRKYVPQLQAGEPYTFVAYWYGSGYIPIDAIQVFAHGVISP
jgi:hypothetical protein